MMSYLVENYNANVVGDIYNTTELPKNNRNCKNYFIFTMLRNPFYRAILHWGEDVDEFEHHVLTTPLESLLPISQTKHLKQALTVFPNVHYIKAEALLNNLSRLLPFADKPFPKEDHLDWREFFKKNSVRDKIFNYYKEDFKEFGYKRLIHTILS